MEAERQGDRDFSTLPTVVYVASQWHKQTSRLTLVRAEAIHRGTSTPHLDMDTEPVTEGSHPPSTGMSGSASYGVGDMPSSVLFGSIDGPFLKPGSNDNGRHVKI